MSDLKRQTELDEGMSPAGGGEVGICTGEAENPAHHPDVGSMKEIPVIITRKINPRFACRLNNRLRRL